MKKAMKDAAKVLALKYCLAASSSPLHEVISMQWSGQESSSTMGQRHHKHQSATHFSTSEKTDRRGRWPSLRRNGCSRGPFKGSWVSHSEYEGKTDATAVASTSSSDIRNAKKSASSRNYGKMSMSTSWY